MRGYDDCCRYHITPEPFRDDHQPPVLMAFDRGLPVDTALQVLSSVASAGAKTLLVWIDDPRPAAPGADDIEPRGGHMLQVAVGEPGDPLSVTLDGVAIFAAEDGTVPVASFRDGLAPALADDPRPTALLVAGGGTVADLVDPWDSMAGARVHCTMITATIGMVPAPEAVESASSGPRTIRSGDTLAVLPVLLPKAAASPLDWEDDTERYETLFTGHRCPEEAMFVIPIPLPAQVPFPTDAP